MSQQMTPEELIKAIIDLKIRPIIKAQNGDIRFQSFENGTVYVELIETTSSCQSKGLFRAKMIEGFLKTLVPEVDKVEIFSSDEKEKE